MVRTRRQSAAQVLDQQDAFAGDGDRHNGARPSHTLLWGLLLYALSTLAGAATSTVVKLLGGGGGMPAMQLVFVRSCVLVVITLPHLRHPAAVKLIVDKHDLLFVRGCLGFSSVALMYCAVRLLPLSDAVSLAFLAPVLVAALSPLTLHERPPRGVLAALLLAAAGALVVAHPPSLGVLVPGSQLGAAESPSKLGVAAALGHATAAAGAKLAVRSLGGGTTSRHVGGVIVLSAGAVSAAGAGAVCLLQRSFVWPQTGAGWAMLLSVGLVAYFHQATMTAGLQRVPVATAATLTYLSIVWSLLADALIFRNPPSGSSVAGAAAICGGGLLVACLRMHADGGDSRMRWGQSVLR